MAGGLPWRRAISAFMRWERCLSLFSRASCCACSTEHFCVRDETYHACGTHWRHCLNNAKPRLLCACSACKKGTGARCLTAEQTAVA